MDVAYLSVWELFIAEKKFSFFVRLHTLKYVMYGMNMGNETIKNWTIFFLVIGDGNDGDARWNLMGLTLYVCVCMYAKRQTVFQCMCFANYEAAKREEKAHANNWARAWVWQREVRCERERVEFWIKQEERTTHTHTHIAYGTSRKKRTHNNIKISRAVFAIFSRSLSLNSYCVGLAATWIYYVYTLFMCSNFCMSERD